MSLRAPVALDEIPAFCRYLASAYGCCSVPFIDIDDVSDYALTCGDRPLVLQGADGDARSAAGLPFAFSGQGVAIVDPNESRHAPGMKAPPHFSVLAIVPTYNECDVIRRTLQGLVSQGLTIHVLDNWSTDGTFDIARAFGECTVEHFPVRGPCTTYDLQSLLARVEVTSRALESSRRRHHGPRRRAGDGRARACRYSIETKTTLMTDLRLFGSVPGPLHRGEGSGASMG